MLIFAGLASLVAVKTPAWEANDEPSHVQNVETLVAGHWYRIPTRIPTDLRSRRVPGLRIGPGYATELHQPPLYYLLLAGWQELAGQPPRTINPGHASFFSTGGLYLHHSGADHRFVLLLRFPNVVLGLLTIWLTFLTARLLSRDTWIPVLAAAIVAFMPKFVSISAFVTNDNLVNTLGALLTYVAVRASGARGAGWIAAVGAVLGLLLITKLSALPAIIVLIPLLLMRHGWVTRVKLLGTAIVAILLIGGWYLIQNQVRYGSPLAAGASSHYLTPIGGLGSFGPYVVSDPLRLIFAGVPSRIFTRFWNSPTLPPFSWPPLVNAVFWIALVLSLAGLVRWHNSRSYPTEFHRQLTVLLTLVVAAFASLWVVAFNTAAYDPRLTLLGLPPLACLAALGLSRWRLPLALRRWRFALALGLPLLELGGTLVAIQQNVLSVPWSH